MSSHLYSHPVCVDHDTGPHHPERPDRLRAVMQALDGEAFDGLVRVDAPQATVEQITRVHDAAYVDGILRSVPRSGHHHIDPDTVMSPKSGEAALRAAGGACAAVDAVLGGEAANAFCSLRPPGHHAEPDRGMGFCLFNNVAIGAAHGAAVHGLERVAVIDFDVHHGNGTQAAFEDRPDFLYVSSHQSPAYPGTGAESERGRHGNILNVAFGPGSGSEAFRQAYEQRILPAVGDWKPDLVMISAGFDAHARDPLGGMDVTEEGFAALCGAVRGVADACCDGRVALTLEGGYDLDGLARSVHACVEVLCGATPPGGFGRPDAVASQVLGEVQALHRRWWPV